ncbi:GMC oxidoreductase [Sporormia fimetaria CBS 119925]|uniref:GMC oxidoreductase n=1 Tax=Sporormia fimetaria CBS 119925 TaxID=1340428 RepID=A0A6A6V153_9PLEO|nr:GMC oxidoreductase [Sporormia fimetaria CBS 119925]
MAPKLHLVAACLSLAVSAAAGAFADINKKAYDYIVVGTGPGGAPLAANLARAGHSVLVLEAGDDQTENLNVSQWFNFNAAGNDPATRWDFFVKHSNDEEQEARYIHRTWRKTDGSFCVGLDPPAGAKPLGVYYPRAGTLGGCAMHNGCLTMNPNDLDWNDIAATTGDDSWSADNMRKYLVKLERIHYNSTYKHGTDGWLDMTMLDPGYNKPDMRQLQELAAEAAGYSKADTPALLQRDMNGDQENRDNLIGPFGGVSHIHPNNRRSSPGYYLRDTVAEKKYPITLSLDTLATKIIFEKKGSRQPKAVGIEFLQGKSMYSADPRYNASNPGIPGVAYASKEVIISGGTFNSPQLLMLSGIGPAKQLKKHKIPVVVDLPGVGQSVSDNYEAGIIALANRPVADPSIIFPSFWKTTQGKIRDIYMWCGGFAFEGFWPGFPNLPPTFNSTYGPREYECALVHMNPRSHAGTVTLRSANPRDMTDINLNFFATPDSHKDIRAILEGIQWVRSWLSEVDPTAENSLAPFNELHPCKGVIGKQTCSDEEQMTYLKEQAYSHHASSSCRIGADGDEMAVLDSKFRVRGVKGLRVVDASSFPKVPGAFPVLPTMMLSEKASEILIKGF